MFEDVIALYGETLSADHLYTGIARIKLGRTLRMQRRYEAAVTELLAGYQIVSKQSAPSVSWLNAARKDLVAVYDSLSRPETAAHWRAELAKTQSR
jgi:hypothetical protein